MLNSKTGTLRHIIAAAFLIAFTVASIMLLIPIGGVNHNAGAISAELEKNELTEGNITRTVYTDKKGQATVAVDIGYAVLEKTNNSDGKLILERYLDENGEPMLGKGGYAGISYEHFDGYDMLTYLDRDGNAMQTVGGYTYIKRTLTESGKADTDTYYDSQMQTVKCSGGYRQTRREYDDNGNNCAVYYYGEGGLLLQSSVFPAIKRYERDSSDRVIKEMAFDASGAPAPTMSGCYGVKNDYNKDGRVIRITYLDADGKPAATTAGYTSLTRTYYRDGTIEKEMYFGADGEPYRVKKGYYGVKISGSERLQLSRGGHVLLNVDNILSGFPFTVVLFGVFVTLLIIVAPKKLRIVLSVLYVVFILYETLMFRETGDTQLNLQLFSYAQVFLVSMSRRTGVINNVWLFVPFGASLYMQLKKKRFLLVPLLFSLAIEVTQYVTSLGIAELDDLFGNTLGGAIGFLAAYELSTAIKMLKQRRAAAKPE